VPAKTTLTIPVSCVEAGRWRARSRVFSAAPRTQHAAGRAKRMAQVSASMRVSGERRSDQAEVWADIAGKACRLGAESSTGAMEEIFLRHAEFAQRCVDALDPIPGQCGALFLLDGRVAGFDLFDRAITLRRLLPKLVRSVAMDALDRPGPGDSFAGASAKPQGRQRSPVDRAAIKPELLLKVAEHFLAATSGAAVEPAGAVGMGIDLRLVAPKITGAALASDNHVVHVSAFQV